MKERKHEAPPRYDAAFKEGAIRLVAEEGRPMREVAEELGVCTDTIRNWLKASGIQPKETERQNRLERRQRDLEAENRALRKQLAQNHIDTALTLAALRMEVRREHPAPGLMFHSDRGVQYAAAAYREEPEKLGFVQSMSRKGEPHDNAVAENFFSCLKCELVYLTSYATRRQAQNSIFRYIEGFYNPVRPHSSIGWLSPMEYARQLNRQNVA